MVSRSSTTVTTTITPTSTVTTDVYAACATNNFADFYNGNTIIDAFPQSAGNATSNMLTSDSAYDCCVAAYTFPGGGPVNFVFELDVLGTCYVDTIGTQCPHPGNNPANAFYSSPGIPVAVVGNSYCGTIIRAEVEP